MASLLFGVHGLRGSLNNSLALAKQLIDADHDVTVAAFRDIGDQVAAIGADYVQLVDGPSAADAVAASVKARGQLRSLAMARRSRRDLVQLDEARRLFQDRAPDLAIIDMEMHGLVLAAQATNTQTLLSIPWHDVFYGEGRPPMHTALLPGSTRRQKMLIRVAWERVFVKRRVRRVLRPLTRAGLVSRLMPFQLNTPELNTIQEMAAAAGVNLDEIASQKHWMKPVVYTHAPVMSFTSLELELDPAASHRVVHVGPLIDPDRRAPDATSRRVEQFTADARERGYSVAYCSMGSLQSANQEYYRAVIEAFDSLTDWTLIIGLGSQGEADSFADSNPNLLVLDDAPQLQILGHASVAIHPGGTGTFYECVRSGVPSVVIHTGHVDMPGIEARVRHHHLGTALNRPSATPDRIASAVGEVVASAVVATNLERHRDVLKGYEVRGAATQLIADMLVQD